MRRLDVVMRLEIQFFLVIVITSIFMGLSLQVINPFMLCYFGEKLCNISTFHNNRQ